MERCLRVDDEAQRAARRQSIAPREIRIRRATPYNHAFAFPRGLPAARRDV
jgi:hypothetical protein